MQLASQAGRKPHPKFKFSPEIIDQLVEWRNEGKSLREIGNMFEEKYGVRYTQPRFSQIFKMIRENQ